jgi:energy-coupling factor transporter ATP-binding protein EcfA2
MSILNDKQIYSLGIDLPPLLYWFFDQVENHQENFPISNQLNEQVNLFNTLLESKNMLPLASNNEYYNFSQYETKNPILSLSKIFFSYPETMNTQFSITNLNLHIFPGEILGLLGPNGAGKTTLINLILGLIQPNEGMIYFKNLEVTNFSVQKRAKIVGVIFQNPDHQLFGKTVYAEMEFSLKNLNLPKTEMAQRIESYLKQFNLWDLKDISPFSLSGGQKRKVAIISIIIREPEIVIFDEPTVGLDAIEKELLEKFILSMQQDGRTVIIISHDMNFISQIATRVCIVKEGQIYADGSLKTILSDTSMIKNCSLEQSHFLQVKNKIPPHKRKEMEQIMNIKQLKEIWS